MNATDIKRITESPEYDFLRTNPHLSDRLMFLTFGGSHAYGTNITTSDIDIRGCALNRPSDIIGMTSFEQFTNEPTDTKIYAFNRFIWLLVDCNPSIIEMLGCRKDQYLYLSELGEELVKKRKMFLSGIALSSFGGYATQQLRRLENALARDRLPQDKKEEHLLGAMERAMKTFSDRYSEISDYGSVKLYIDSSKKKDLSAEIFADVDLKHYPAREFCGIINDLNSVLRTYEKLNGRNHKKDDAHLNKHAMHLVRLLLTCIDIFEKGDIITYREENLDLLRSIRAGRFQNTDGTYQPEFFELVSDLNERMEYAAQNSSLPKEPDMKLIGEFVEYVNRASLG